MVHRSRGSSVPILLQLLCTVFGHLEELNPNIGCSSVGHDPLLDRKSTGKRHCRMCRELRMKDKWQLICDSESTCPLAALQYQPNESFGTTLAKRASYGLPFCLPSSARCLVLISNVPRERPNKRAKVGCSCTNRILIIVVCLVQFGGIEGEKQDAAQRTLRNGRRKRKANSPRLPPDVDGQRLSLFSIIENLF